MDKLGINLVNHLENVALIYWKIEQNCEILKYKDVLKQVIKISLFIEENNVPKESTIGICCGKSFSLVLLTLGVLESDYSFCYITKDDIENNLDDFNVKYLFSETKLFNENVKFKKTLILNEKELYFYNSTSKKDLKLYNDAGDKMNRICYSITTSGTTGKKKIVRVSYHSIYSNMKSLQNIFQLNGTDVIFSASPTSFDVFILDMLMAFYTGASLLIIPENLRFNTFVFSKVTFFQTTPTLFQQYGLENITTKILHSTSSLKYLLLGGENFPRTKEILTWQNWDDENRKRIFNIYGITEMSCWALIQEVTKEDFINERIPLGKPLDNTSLAYYPYENTTIEEIVLTTNTRVNFVNNSEWDKLLDDDKKDKIFAYVTNDLVERIGDKIYWHGRRNDLIKKFGEKVDLNKIESVATEIINPVACIFTKKRIALFYQSEDNNFKETLSNYLKLKLKPSEFPDDIKRIAFLPTCANGKVSKNKLKEIYKDILIEDQSKQSTEDIFIEAINQIFNLKLGMPSKSNDDEPDGKRMRTDIDSTFNQIGGTSFDALRIAMKMEDKTNTISNDLLPKLLDNQHTIKEIFTYLKDLNPKPKKYITKPFQVVKKLKLNVTILQKHDLKKCIDSSPALFTFDESNFVLVGSHSGQLLAIDAEELSATAEMQFKDRIECEVAQFKNYGVVGCYDGFLYCFDFLKKEIIWSFNSNGMIKSKPLIINDEFIIFGNYNYKKNLHSICIDDSNNVKLKWDKSLGSAGIIANLLQLDNSSFIACTLDGTCERMNVSDGGKIWTKKFSNPIFSSPKLISGRNEFIVAEVMRKIHCLDFDGNVIWNFETEGHIFSSFHLIYDNENHQNSLSTKILFGSHDKKLRCLNYNYGTEAKLEWENELQSQIYGTPKIIEYKENNYVISCSTNGYINLIKLSDGILETSIKLPGEIFSSPIVFKNTIFVGCRDNFLYCLQIKPY